MFEKSKNLSELAKTVIRENEELKRLDNPNPRIAFLYCDKVKTSNGKKVYADTTKLNDKTKAVAEGTPNGEREKYGKLSDDYRNMDIATYAQLQGYDALKAYDGTYVVMNQNALVISSDI